MGRDLRQAGARGRPRGQGVRRRGSLLASALAIACCAAALLLAAVGVSGAQSTGAQPTIGEPARDASGCARIESALAPLADWPRVTSRIRRSPVAEERVRRIVAGMSLEEKVGQMTQPEIAAITPDQVREFHIGSILNGGGSFPGADKRSAPGAWIDLADAYWEASKAGNSAGVPAIWGIDAVHGNSNVFGATLFPHNIGLGAAKDPCLARQVQQATARQMKVTGQDWAFAPTLAVPRDDRWGRTYEGFSEDPALVRAYGYESVRGLQGTSRRGIAPEGVIATAKHFIGDGGTENGRDQGVTPSSEYEMVNLHGQGY